MTKLQRLLLVGGSLLFFFLFVGDASAAPLIPNVNIDVGSSDNPQDVAVTLQLMAVLTILSIAPSILIMTTAFIRIVVVLGFLRNAMSTQTTPPNMVIIGLSLFLTFYCRADNPGGGP